MNQPDGVRSLKGLGITGRQTRALKCQRSGHVLGSGWLLGCSTDAAPSQGQVFRRRLELTKGAPEPEGLVQMKRCEWGGRVAAGRD